jgi:hypothetical protein
MVRIRGMWVGIVAEERPNPSYGVLSPKSGRRAGRSLPQLPARTGRYPFRRGRVGYERLMREVLVVSAILSLAGVVAYIGLLLWAAREDGREQERRNRGLPGSP